MPRFRQFKKGPPLRPPDFYHFRDAPGKGLEDKHGSPPHLRLLDWLT